MPTVIIKLYGGPLDGCDYRLAEKTKPEEISLYNGHDRTQLHWYAVSEDCRKATYLRSEPVEET